jgi:crotonobetainyl-CoA:carnitine CoA-transferase CaiB-like acyl-CoA transferase
MPASPVHTLDQVVQHEQVLTNKMIVQAQDYGAKQVSIVGVRVKMSETPRWPAPRRLPWAATLTQSCGDYSVSTSQKLRCCETQGRF